MEKDYLTARAVISTILLNQDTEEMILQSYIQSYLKRHPQMLKVSKIYAVYAESGSYSDHEKRLVKTFRDIDTAKQFVFLCNEEVKTIKVKIEKKEIERRVCKHQYDPQYNHGYYDAEYHYEEVELV